ncbi:phage tail assembly chaperone [Ensifer aridi]|uniref:phage tail assembly chaperone n=1 Tax=Ensifer aridi TaxID=1708715 RepID=UPI000A11B2FB|nr:phage tail assembly chaperone [Ensifer aridi]
MFKLSKSFTFPWPVKVLEPDQNNPGKLLEHEFAAQFLLIDREEAAANDRKRLEIVMRSREETDPAKLRTIMDELAEHDRASIKRVLCGWDERLCDESGKPIPFDEVNLREVMKHARVEAALARAYSEAISEDKARLGN